MIVNKKLFAGIIGNTIEWYDFALFNAFAITISTLFFPNDDSYTSLLKTYGIFACGFITRPMGSLILGFVGDKYGRKIALSLSILLMAIPTGLIGLLPVYADVGIKAPLYLILLRLFQGFAIGGEYSGSMVYLSEHTQSNTRAFFSSWADFGCLLGVLLGSLAALITNYCLLEKDLFNWGWRIPFLLGGLLIIPGLYYRNIIQETEYYSKSNLTMKKKNALLILLTNKILIIKATMIFAFGNVSFYIFLVFLPNYYILNGIIISPSSSATTSLMSLMLALFIPIAGYLSDIYGRKLLLSLGIIGTSIFSVLLFSIGGTEPLFIILFFVIIAFTLALFYGGEAAFLSELFPTYIRYSAVSVTVSLSNILFGGGTPFLSSLLVQKGSNLMFLSIPVIMLGLFALLALKYSDKSSSIS
jgi:MHS family proline/betaine transporter-like MFS transporter